MRSANLQLRRDVDSAMEQSPKNAFILHKEKPNTKRKISLILPSIMFSKKKTKADPLRPVKVWARPEMKVTFRAEVMPGRSRDERTFRIKTVFQNGRVELYDFPDEHREGAFEPMNFLRNTIK